MTTSLVGLVGVGRMGLPILQRLRAAGFEVLAHDVRPERAAPPSVPTVGELARAVDILVTALPGVSELEDVMADALPQLAGGSTWLDLTSNDPRVADAIAARATAREVESVAAPMAGGIAAAKAGTLRFFVGGREQAIGTVLPLLAALGEVERAGDTPGSAHSAKLIANLLWFGQVVAVTEALLLGQSLGLPPGSLRSLLARSAGGSVFIDEHLDRLLDGDYLESFGLDRCVEELDILASLARDARVPFELSALVARLHRDALERFGAVEGELLAAKLLEERAGRDLRR